MYKELKDKEKRNRPAMSEQQRRPSVFTKRNQGDIQEFFEHSVLQDSIVKRNNIKKWNNIVNGTELANK